MTGRSSRRASQRAADAWMIVRLAGLRAAGREEGYQYERLGSHKDEHAQRRRRTAPTACSRAGWAARRREEARLPLKRLPLKL